MQAVRSLRSPDRPAAVMGIKSRKLKYPSGKAVTMADSSEVDLRKREIQLIFNIIEPDPEYQPVFTSDEATLMDSTGLDKELVLARLESFFHLDCRFALQLPLWQIVDELKSRLPGWPDDWHQPNH